MQKTITENTYKYLQPGKIKRIYKILAFFEKSGGLEKSWRFYENQADLRNLGAFTKIRWILRNLGVFTKIRRI
jgi:hypothetical protein